MNPYIIWRFCYSIEKHAKHPVRYEKQYYACSFKQTVYVSCVHWSPTISVRVTSILNNFPYITVVLFHTKILLCRIYNHSYYCLGLFCHWSDTMLVQLVSWILFTVSVVNFVLFRLAFTFLLVSTWLLVLDSVGSHLGCP